MAGLSHVAEKRSSLERTSLLADPNRRHPHPRACSHMSDLGTVRHKRTRLTNTHAAHSNLLVRSPELIEQRANLPRSCAAQRMPEGDSATFGVDPAMRRSVCGPHSSETRWNILLHGDSELVCAPQALRGKRLVDLVDVDIIFRDACLFQCDGNGLPWADTHKERRHAHDGRCHVFAEDLLAQPLSCASFH